MASQVRQRAFDHLPVYVSHDASGEWFVVVPTSQGMDAEVVALRRAGRFVVRLDAPHQRVPGARPVPSDYTRTILD